MKSKVQKNVNYGLISNKVSDSDKLLQRDLKDIESLYNEIKTSINMPILLEDGEFTTDLVDAACIASAVYIDEITKDKGLNLQIALNSGLKAYEDTRENININKYLQNNSDAYDSLITNELPIFMEYERTFLDYYYFYPICLIHFCYLINDTYNDIKKCLGGDSNAKNK